MPIEGDGFVVLRMDGQCADADHVGHLQRSSQRIEQQSRAYTLPLRRDVNGQSRQNQKRDRMAGHALHDALRRIRVMHFAGDNCVETDDFLLGQGDVGLR